MRRATTTKHALAAIAVAAIAFEGRFVDRTRSVGHSERWDDSQLTIHDPLMSVSPDDWMGFASHFLSCQYSEV